VPYVIATSFDRYLRQARMAMASRIYDDDYEEMLLEYYGDAGPGKTRDASSGANLCPEYAFIAGKNGPATDAEKAVTLR